MKEINIILLIKIIILGLVLQFILLAIGLGVVLSLSHDQMSRTFINDSILSILWSVICAPLWEELFFRRWLYTKLKSKVSVKKSIIISSILFGLIHINPILIFLAIIIGYISCNIYENTNLIIYSIIFHSACNLFSEVFRPNIINNIYNWSLLNLNMTLIMIFIFIIISICLFIIIYREIISIKGVYKIN